MSAQHTPGPWVPHASKCCLDFGIVVEDRFVIAEVFSDIRDAHVRHIEEARCNAKLIAAAPRLLGACNGLLGLLQMIASRPDLPDDLRDALSGNHRVIEAELATAQATGAPSAETAIAKATGAPA